MFALCLVQGNEPDSRALVAAIHAALSATLYNNMYYMLIIGTDPAMTAADAQCPRILALSPNGPSDGKWRRKGLIPG